MAHVTDSSGQDISLLKKYNQEYINNYSDYPPKDAWSYDFSSSNYTDALINTYSKDDKLSSLLYVHTPFCEQLCYFCFCSTLITNKYANVNTYLHNYLIRELGLLSKAIDSNKLNPNINQIYLGGGSPTYYNEKDFLVLMDAIKGVVSIDNIDTFTIEVDPRRVNVEKLQFYKACGVNRLSFGIQDFDLNVQKEINRVQPYELIEDLLTDDVRTGLKAINFDLLVGLPAQTPDSINTTIDLVNQLAPDEVQVMFLHYKPQLRKHMTRMVRNRPLPDFVDRKDIFTVASDKLQSNGYRRAGLESFCKENRVLSESMSEGTAYYNSLGTQPEGFVSFLAVGSSGQGMIGENYYVQNFYEQKLYKEALDNDQFPIYRGYQLTDDDKVRREIINSVRTYFLIDKRFINEKYHINFDDTFSKELEVLETFVDDGLVEDDGNTISLTELGQHLCLSVAQVFDSVVTVK